MSPKNASKSSAGSLRKRRQLSTGGQPENQATGRTKREEDTRWVLEYLVRKEGQRRAASILRVDRKTVARDMERGTPGRAVQHAVERLLRELDGPTRGKQEQAVSPLDQLVQTQDRNDEALRRLTDQVNRLELGRS